MPILRRLLSVVTAAAVTAAVVVVPSAPASAAEEVYPAPASGSWTVDGRAWGHGRGMSQWGAQRQAQAGRTANQILDFYYPGTASTTLQGGDRWVTVALTSYTPTTSVTIWSTPDRPIRLNGAEVLPSGRWTITVSGATVTAERRALDAPTGPVLNRRTVSGSLNTTVLRLESLSPTKQVDQGGLAIAGSQTATAGRWYRGELRIVPTGAGGGAGFNVTNRLPMEDYLRSVVPRESPASWEYAALEAQAVAARTYARYRVVNGSALCDTTTCQVYYGKANVDHLGAVTELFENARTDTAIRATAHRVLTYQGRIAFTEFSSNNGGWTVASSVPYQVAKSDPWNDDSVPRAVWTDTLSVSRVEQSCPAGGRLRNLVVVSRNGNGPLGGRITQARLECTNGNRTISNPAFGLYSSWWKPRPSVPRLEQPAISAREIDPGDVVVIGVTPNLDMSWTLTVRDRSTNRLVRTVTGNATVGKRFNAGWDTRYDGATSSRPYVGPGTYELRIVGTDVTGKTSSPVTRTVTVRKPADPSPVKAVPLVGDAGYVPLTPQRIVDTRQTFQALGPGQRADVTVLGQGGVPTSGVTAVVLNVTMVTPATDGHLRVWPAGQPRPGASAVNTTGGRDQASLVTVGVGGEGKVSVYNAAGTTHYLVDVLGYYTTDLSASARYTPAQSPVRALDSRSVGRLGEPGRTTMTVDVAKALGVAARDVSAAVVNVTTTRPLGHGHVVAYGAGSRPSTSTVNLQPGADVANRAVVPVVDGKITLAHSGAPTHVVVDVNGWYGRVGATSGATFTPLQPTRVLDSRSGVPFGERETRSLRVLGGSVPTSATAVVGTLTAVDQTSHVTHARIWPAGLPLTPTSELNSGRGRTQANAVVVRPGTQGAVQLYNDLGRSHLVLDLVGYFR